MTEPYRVFVVLDREYGQCLVELAEKGPVWIVDTLENRTIAQHLSAAHPNRSHLEEKRGKHCDSDAGCS